MLIINLYMLNNILYRVFIQRRLSMDLKSVVKENKQIKGGMNLYYIIIGFIVFNLFVIISSLFLKGSISDNSTFDVGNEEIYEKNINNNIVPVKSEKKSSPVVTSPETIKVFLREQNKVVTLNLEEYVVGVVSAEMPASFNIEALKAQAVAARTYAVAHIKSVTGTGCPLNSKADICDSVHCQVYMDKKTRLDKWNEKDEEGLYKKIVDAVKSTKGELLTYEGKLVLSPYYFSTSSGNTESSEDIFGVDEPYLKSVPSQGEDKAYKYETKYTMTKYQFLKVVKDKYPDLNMKSANINSNTIKIKEKTSNGTVKEITIGNICIKGTELRSIFKLTSANFTMTYSGDNLNIVCKGYGHGVGMSQWGAGVMAKEGFNYKDILTHYYTGVDVNKIEI